MKGFGGICTNLKNCHCEICTLICHLQNLATPNRSNPTPNRKILRHCETNHRFAKAIPKKQIKNLVILSEKRSL